MTTTNPISLDNGRRAALAGAASAGLALAITELVAGITELVPSAIASVGTFVVDYSPPFVKQLAISLFGTSDKGALAIGTVIFGLLFGAIIGALARNRPWIAPVAFTAFALLGLAATFSQPSFHPLATFVTIDAAAITGYLVLVWLLRSIDLRAPETPIDGMPVDAGRRRFMVGVAGAGASALVAGAAGRSLIISRSEEVRSAIDLPPPQGSLAAPTADTFYSIDGLESIVVPNDSFYRIDTALIVPRPDAETWKLKITGMVDNELEFTLSDLLAMPLYERYVTIACVSNEVGGRLVGNAKWTGVLLSDLLDRAGVQPGADQIVGRSVDDWTAGFPTELAFDGREPLVAVGMNDEMLPPRHGYPARLIVPGLYGYVSATKWLQEIELTTWEGFDGYWIPRGWSKEGPIKTQSRIDVPGSAATVPSGTVAIAGVAWAPLKGISKVEVRLDDGDWEEAALTTPLSDTAWVQWLLEKELPPNQEYRIQVRATDGTGETQTSANGPPAPNGATGYHTRTFRTA